MPSNFGLADRSGTDGLVHMARAVVEQGPSRVALSIDGVGAFDHISRARIFREIWARPQFHELLPFIRCWYGAPTNFQWLDDSGEAHLITQGEGGEQGDALMPA
eukprot:12406523-Karenia_brevis.AAC.1